MKMAIEELEEVRLAKRRLENPGLAAKIADIIGKPVEKLIEVMPDQANEKVLAVTRVALEKSIQVVAKTIRDSDQGSAHTMGHKLAVGLTGGVGGGFGLAALPVELPISTSIILRSILDIARSEGEDVATPQTQLAATTVLALGGPSEADDGAEVGYWATRAILMKSVADAAEFMAEKGLADQAAPVLVQLIRKVAERFSVQVGEKIAAQAAPVIGALGGATVNIVFMDHFQQMARGHFVIRRLERKYGTEVVQAAYAAA